MVPVNKQFDSDYPVEKDAAEKFFYEEFKLSSLELHNLEEIEQMIEQKSYTKKRVDDSLDYLYKLQHRLREIKQIEAEFEGEKNYNINQALLRIKRLTGTLETINTQNLDAS